MGGTGAPEKSARNAPIVGGRKNEAVENVRLAAAGDVTQKGGGQAMQGTSTTGQPGGSPTRTKSGFMPAVAGAGVSMPQGAGLPVAGSVPSRAVSAAGMPAVSAGAGANTPSTTGQAKPAGASAGLAASGTSASGKTTTTGQRAVVVMQSGKRVKIEAKKTVEATKTRAVVERTTQVTRQDAVQVVQQTAQAVRVVAETTHKTAVKTATEVAQVHVATTAVSTTVQHQQTKATVQKTAERAALAESDVMASVQAGVVEGERLMASAPGIQTPFRADGTLARATSSHVDGASDRELDAASQGLARIDVVEAARAFAELDLDVDLTPVVRAQRESDIQDALFRETQASTVSLGSHAAPPFSSVAFAIDRKLEVQVELTREERAQQRALGAPYASADDATVALPLASAKAIEEMALVVGGELGSDVADLGDAMRTLMDSDGGGDDGGGDGGGDEGGGGGDGGGGGGGD